MAAFSVKHMFYLSALLLECSVVKEGRSMLTRPLPPLDCRVVLCARPDCDNPIPPKPGQCCPTCPDNPTIRPPFPPLRCPTLPRDSFGTCVELCTGVDGCPEGQLCCSNGCGHVCKVGVPDVCKLNGKVYQIGESFPAGDGCNTWYTFPPTTIPPPPTCPPDKPMVNCFVDPCMFAKCPAHPNAQCVSDYCGGCNARFFEDGEEVTDTCRDVCVRGDKVYNIGDSFPAGDGCNTCSCIRPNVIVCTLIACPPPTTIPPPPTCPPDKPMVNCFVDPCMFAKCPAHPNARCVSDFCGGCNARYFEDGEEVTDTCDCPVKGQVFTECGSACPANCTTPNPICTLQCVPRCQCPRGKVINEVTNRCVRQSLCPLPGGGNCPPTCTASFCKRNRKALCSKPGPREIPGCTGSCQVTFCHVCYFSSETRSLPGKCRTCGAPVSSRRCLNRWANCIYRSDFFINDHVPCDDQTQDIFKCYPYPCPLKG